MACARSLGSAHRYDKAKVLMREVSGIQFVAAMNPTAGSFNITPRMQRHFATFAVHMPGPEAVRCTHQAAGSGASLPSCTRHQSSTTLALGRARRILDRTSRPPACPTHLTSHPSACPNRTPQDCVQLAGVRPPGRRVLQRGA